MVMNRMLKYVALAVVILTSFVLPTLGDSEKDLYYLVVDKSASIRTGMLQEPISLAVKEFVNTLPPEAEIRLVFFSDRAEDRKVWPSMTLDAKKSFDDYFSANFKPGGMTRLFDTVVEVIEEVNAISKKYRDIKVMILSDGDNTVKSNYKDWSIIENLAGDLKRDNGNAFVFWYTIGSDFVPKNPPRKNVIVSQKPDTKNLKFEPAPVADFDATVKVLESGQATKFMVAPSPGKITEVRWSFGDGQTDGRSWVEHKYDRDGKYSVSLTVKGPGGSSSVTKDNFIEVIQTVPPKAAFSWIPEHPRVGERVQMVDKSAGQPDTYAWDFGKYGKVNERIPSFQLDEAGELVVSLIVGKGKQQSSSGPQTITVLPMPPSADFKQSVNELFIGDSIDLSAVSDGDAVTHEWGINGKQCTGPSATWTADVLGLVEIVHRATGAGGGVVKTGSVYVRDRSTPAADFTILPKGDVSLKSSVTIKAVEHKDGYVHTWDICGKQFSGEEIKWTADVWGGVDIMHHVEAFGKTNELVKQVTVTKPLPPSADFSILPAFEVSQFAKVTLIAADTNANVTHSWLVAGKKYVGTRVEVSAEVAGPVEVRHEVDGVGGKNRVEKSFYVKKTDLINVQFEAQPLSGKYPLEVVFTDNSKGAAVAYQWNFGDGTTSSDKKPKHIYSRDGEFKVSLKVRNAAGEETTSTQPVIISVKAPPPTWMKWAIIGGILAVIAFVLLLVLRPEPPGGTLGWEFKGKRGKMDVDGTAFRLSELNIPEWTPKKVYVIKKKKRGDVKLFVDGIETKTLGRKTVFTLEGVDLTYTNDMLS